MPKVTRRYSVDLREPADERWDAMIEKESARGRDLIAACLEPHKKRAWGLGALGVAVAKRIVSGGDADAWANGAEIDRNELILANLSYELAQSFNMPVVGHVKKWLGFGCTAAAYNLPKGQGVAHVRNLDWPLPECGPSTALIDFQSESGPFTAVGWLAFIGILSAVAPGRFSATINMAPQAGMVTAHWPPSFALRHIFERCEDFDDAVDDEDESRREHDAGEDADRVG